MAREFKPSAASTFNRTSASHSGHRRRDSRRPRSRWFDENLCVRPVVNTACPSDSRRCFFIIIKKTFFVFHSFTGFLLPDECSQVAQNHAAKLNNVLMCAITLGYACTSAVANIFPPTTTDFLYDVRPSTDYNVSTPPHMTFGITCAHPRPREPFPPLSWPFFCATFVRPTTSIFFTFTASTRSCWCLYQQ